MPSLTELAKHITTLARQHRLRIEFHDGPARHAEAFFLDRRIRIPRIKTHARYAAALHEIGHLASRSLSHPLMFQEGAAWQWARTHALEWSPAMQRAMLQSLRFYLNRIVTDATSLQSNWRWPPRSHPFWQLMQDEPDVRKLLNKRLPAWLSPDSVHIPWHPILTHPDRPRCKNCAYWTPVVTFEKNDVPEKRTMGICTNRDRPLGVELTPSGALCGLSHYRKPS